eukprot:6709889-Alexandrium_andersonii.AAC.1
MDRRAHVAEVDATQKATFSKPPDGARAGVRREDLGELDPAGHSEAAGCGQSKGVGTFFRVQ